MQKVFQLSTLLSDQAKKYGKRAALFYRDALSKKWLPVSWNELYQKVETLAGSLIESNVKSEEKVGIFAPNMPEAIMADFANYAVHAISVPLYATSTASQIEYIVDDSEIGIIYAGEQYQYDVACEVLKTSKTLHTVVAMSPAVDLKGVAGGISLKDFMAKGEMHPHTEEIAERRKLSSQDDLVNILYTSGTTGQPKGVMLHQYNYTEIMRTHNDILDILNDKDTSMCFLPLTHVFERAWTYFCLQKGIQVYVNKDTAAIASIMPEVRPTVMCAVPRYWEKVYAAVQAKIESSPSLVQKLFRYSIKLGYKRNLEYKRFGKRSPLSIGLPYKFLAKPLFNKVKKVAGIDNGRLFPVAGARLSDEINEFLHALDIKICYGYGLTESCATVCCYDASMKNYIIGSVGKIIPDLQVKISNEGEILLKGKTITSGYYKRPDANKEAFTEDGFFRTGDAGYLDMENNLYITDRIKDLFKTAGGKYIAPQLLESLVSDDALVEQAVAIGNERKYVSMLIVPDYLALEPWAKNKGIAYASRAELIQHPEVIAAYQAVIDQKNAELARYEQIKRFTLLEKAFTMEQGHLTNTLKIKRKVVNELFAKEINAMYPND
jgi:long-chain acyl-CoA synthetase